MTFFSLPVGLIYGTISQYVKKNFNSNTIEITRDQLPETEMTPEPKEKKKNTLELDSEVRLDHMKGTLICKEDGGLRFLRYKDNKE